MIDWAADFIDAIGLLGVAALVALENVFPPIPSELVLLLTGFNVSETRFGYVGAVVFATIGSVVGAYFLYGIGRLLSEDRLESFLAGIGRFVGLKKSDVHKGFQWFERHGSAVVLFGRLIPVVRSVVSIPAGAEKMPLVRFSMLTALGSLAWNAIWIAVGWGLGDQWKKAGTWGDYIQYGAVAVILVVLVVVIVRARRKSSHSVDSEVN
ncbi:MAG: DedA family protein [Ilumatobacteraceae bacterium]|jgi:membrane protein DedA with SNARE-associated domain|nr:DedA family protein [Actinomycetota bacterium]MDA3011319.1 DedA family protein [Actinomycetota bacterium]MDA3025780.1 DedA family protein [Actinomycetota bacterium]